MSLIVFFLINLVGDPVDMLVNPESLPEEIERVRKDFGLDQPVHIQYLKLHHHCALPTFHLLDNLMR